MALRILGGEHRSRLLKAPEGRDTRPTRSMVREAVFNMLQGACPGSRVLDVFAGSGAMGLEALSRGASYAVFCDVGRQAVEAVRSNLSSLKLADKARVLQAGWEQAFISLGREGQAFDLIFLDPPYKMEAEPLLQMLLHHQLLSVQGSIILEQGRGSSLQVPPGLPLLKERR